MGLLIILVFGTIDLHAQNAASKSGTAPPISINDSSKSPPEAIKTHSYPLDTLLTPYYPLDAAFLKYDTVYTVTSQYIHTEKDKTSKPLYLALKTNLFYDAMLLPNLSLEWYMDKKWSLLVEGNWSWWTFGAPVQNQWHHRIQSAGIELRYWFESPHPLHGHALGVYSMIGNYDIRLFAKDEYTKGYLSYRSPSVGLSYAYSFPIADKFNLELGIAAGYMGGRYYKYDYCMTHEQWTKRSRHNKNYIGPTRVGVSLVWLLGTANKEKNGNNNTTRKKQKQEQITIFKRK